MNAEAILYRELFQFLTPRQGLSRSIPASAIDLPRPLARGVVHFYSLLKTETLKTVDDDLADQLARDIGIWFVRLYLQLEANIRDAADPSYSDRLTGPDPDSLIENLLNIFPERRDAIEGTTDPGIRIAIAEKLALDADRLEEEQRNVRIERALRLVTTPLADHLNEVVPRIAETDRQITSVFRRPGAWNIFDPLWFDLDWTDLERTRLNAESEQDLGSLSGRIVRGVEPTRNRSVWRQEPQLTTHTVEEDVGIGDVIGLIGTNSPKLALPAEISLLAHPETEPLFSRKMAERGVLALETRRFETRQYTEEHLEWRLRDAPVRLGPIVVCLDTSGSMRGTPEDIAFSFVLLIIQEALQQHRKVDVIATRETLHVASFQPVSDLNESETTGGEIFAAGPTRVDPVSAFDLAAVLKPTDTGGADISPALDTALSRAETRDDRETAVVDFVLISDMLFPKFGPTNLNRIQEMQSRGWARFHALTINRRPIYDPLNVYDYRWHYNTAEELDFRPTATPRRIGLTGQST